MSRGITKYKMVSGSLSDSLALTAAGFKGLRKLGRRMVEAFASGADKMQAPSQGQETPCGIKLCFVKGACEKESSFSYLSANV